MGGWKGRESRDSVPGRVNLNHERQRALTRTEKTQTMLRPSRLWAVSYSWNTLPSDIQKAHSRLPSSLCSNSTFPVGLPCSAVYVKLKQPPHSTPDPLSSLLFIFSVALNAFNLSYKLTYSSCLWFACYHWTASFTRRWFFSFVALLYLWQLEVCLGLFVVAVVVVVVVAAVLPHCYDPSFLSRHNSHSINRVTWMNEWIAKTWLNTRCYSKGFPCNYSRKGVLHISFPFHFHPTLTSSITLFFIFSLHFFSSCFSIGNFEIILYFPIPLH